MAKGRESKCATLDKMIRVLQLVNALSPLDPTLDGDPITLERFADMVGLSTRECARILSKINYGCGDALPAAYVDFDEKDGTIVPHRLVFAFDGFLRLSRSEAYALLVALRSSGIDPAGKLARKLQGALPDFDLERFSDVRENRGMPAGTLALLADAIASHAVLSVDYLDVSGNATHREVEPLSIWYDSSESTWLFSAWCRLRGDTRVFRCDRLVTVPVRTGEPFEPRDVTDPLGSLDRLDTASTAVLAIHDPDSLAAVGIWRGLTAEDRPTEAQKNALSSDEVARGAFIATIPWVEGSSWLTRAVVSTLGGVEVLEPPTLRSQARDLARSLLERLDGRDRKPCDENVPATRL